jgi:transposase InsO family protein
MTTSDTALWRYSVIAPLLHLGGESLIDAARRLAAEPKTGSDGSHVTVSASTILRWFREWQSGGIDALERRPRSDRGERKALSEKVIAFLLDTASAHSEWTVRAILRNAERTLGRKVPEKAAYRLLAGHRRKSKSTDTPRREVGVPQSLWIADTWHGPAIYGSHRKKQKSFLIAIMDDASRMIMAGRFVLRDDIASLIPILRDAALARGLPARLLVDNGANYRSRVIRVACATLGIHLIHATPYRPTAKARLERFWLTARLRLLPELSPFPTMEELNTQWLRFLSQYHAEAHSTLTEIEGRPISPMTYYLSHLPKEVRYVSEVSLDELLVVEETRRVLSDGTFRLGGTIWEAGCEFAGERILVRFNPARPDKAMFRKLGDKGARFQPARKFL